MADGAGRTVGRLYRRTCAAAYAAEDVHAPLPWLLLVAALIFAASGPMSRWLQRRKDSMTGPAHPPRLVPLFISTVAVCF